MSRHGPQRADQDPVRTSETGREARRNAEREVDDEASGQLSQDGLFAWFFATFLRAPQIEQRTRQRLGGQATGLISTVPTRPEPTIPAVNYLSIDHPTLYRMVHDRTDPGQVDSVGESWIQVGNEMTTFQRNVRAAVERSADGWTGEAAEAARRFISSVGEWVGEAGESAQLAGTQITRQGEAAALARRDMPPPVEFDLNAALLGMMATQHPMTWMTTAAVHAQTFYEQQDAHRRAAEVMQFYDADLGATSTMPAFAAPPTLGGGGAPTYQMGASGPGVPGMGTGTVGPVGGGGVPGYGGVPGAGGGWSGPVRPVTGPGPAGGYGPGSGRMHGMPAASSPATAPGGAGGYRPGMGGTPGMAGAMPPAGAGAGGGAAREHTPRQYGRAGGGLGPSATRLTPGGPGGHFGAMGGGAGAGGAGAAGGFGPAGAGSGTGGSAGSVRAGLGGVAGGTAAGGAPFGANGRPAEDDEHVRPGYLVEPDPDLVFGTSEHVAPPVIGNW